MPPDPSAVEGQAPDQRLGRRQRLVSPKLFDEAYEQNRKYVGRHMVLFLREGADAALRLGVVTGRKVGAAHMRVRARRRLREIFRRHRARFSGQFDVVIVARNGADSAAPDVLLKDFLLLAKRAGLLTDA
jgi:ribonuclease P protein component